MNCSRCDVEMSLVDWRDSHAWSCPCCKSHMRTGQMIRADRERRATDLGLTLEEYSARERVLFRDTSEPLSDVAQTNLAETISRRAVEWTPACPHDKNPWTTPADEL